MALVNNSDCLILVCSEYLYTSSTVNISSWRKLFELVLDIWALLCILHTMYMKIMN